MEAHFSVPEVRRVLAHYALGETRSVRELRGGTRASAKAVVECTRGAFLLKRLEARDADPAHLVFRHTLMLAARRAGVRVPELIGTRDDNNSMLQLDHRVYELARFIPGRAFMQGESTLEDAAQAGSTLAAFHRATGGIALPTTARARGGELFAGEPPAGCARAVERAWREARDRRAAQGEPRRALHGDVHPGNVIYDGAGEAWLLDFDAAHAGVASDDLAQGAGQFAWAGDRASASGDRLVLEAFWHGYASARGPGLMPADDAPWRIAGSLALEIAGARGDAGHTADEATRMGAEGERRVAALVDRAEELAGRLRDASRAS
ncbi:MAG: phosphotransferase [Planctomycetota bacterium]